jgi:hypothetical protein
MKSIKLERAIDVRCWRVIGQVAKAARRAELIPVLLRARERGETDDGDLAEHLLFEAGSRRVVAQRLLQIASYYGLLAEENRRYRLTEQGQTALTTKQIFVPEHGTWTIWASNDPLLATPVLRVEPWKEPHAGEEAPKKHTDALEKRRARMKRLPPWVVPAPGKPLGVLQPEVGGAPLRIDQVEAEGEEVDLETTLRATWDVSGARLRVNGILGEANVDTAIDAPAIGAAAVWPQLLHAEGLLSRWDASEEALRIGFDEATPGERESMVRAVVFKRPNIPSFGAFDPATVEGVALRARTPQDAARWAEWRLRMRVRDYATTERFSTWTTEAVAPFPEFQPATPTRRALAHAEWPGPTDRPTPSAWHLVAAEDWRL